MTINKNLIVLTGICLGIAIIASNFLGAVVSIMRARIDKIGNKK